MAFAKDEILDEIRQTTLENGGRPLGRKSFEQATGISPYEWGRYWARFGDALREAGFEANQLNEAFPDSRLLEALAALVRELGRIPSVAELRLARTHDPSFPSEKVFARLGRRNERLGRLVTFCEEANDYADVAAIAAAAYRPDHPAETAERTPTGAVRYGFVYLVRGHPGEYKIGRTNLVDRRMTELGAKAAIEHEVVHLIKTDDPVGVEAYWLARFEKAGKRMRGEWFRLQAGDVAAFGRWKRIA